MGIISKLFERRTHPSQSASWLIEALGGMRSAAGVDVTPESSLKSTVVYACVRILAETVASLPLILYRRLDRGKERAHEHSLYRLLHDLPNPEMTSFELREVFMGHLALRGNAYGNIVWSRGGTVKEIWPLRPDRMRVERRNGVLRYYYALPDGTERVLNARDVWHIKGFGNGLVGYSPIALAREAVGLALATEEYGARFFSNNSRPGGVLETDGRLSDEAFKRLKKSWEEAHSGLSNAHRVAILEEGVHWKQVGIAPEDAQYLDTRKFQTSEIARIFRIPPHMIGDLERATFSNIEHQSIEFVMHTIVPWLRRWEQSIHRDLLVGRERDQYFAEFLVDGLLRGDIKSRYEAYAIGRQNGWLSANDIREMENKNPIENGDVYLVPLNMIPADSLTAAAPELQEPEGRSVRETREARARRYASSRRQVANSYRQVFVDAAIRVIRRERADIMREAEKNLGRRGIDDFEVWLEEFYREHEEFVHKNMEPAHMALAEATQALAAEEIGAEPGMSDSMRSFMDAYLTAFVARHIQSSLGQLRSILRLGPDEETVLEALRQRFDEWDEKRPGKIAMWETVRTSNAVAKETWTENGVIKLRWNNFNPSCPYCQDLDGTVVGIHEHFIEPHVEFQPDGADKPLVNTHPVGHAPAHEGCDCQISPVL